MKTLCAFSMILFAARTLAWGADPDPLPQEIAPTDSHLHYYARLDPRDPKAPRFDWAGSSITIRFEGTAVNARLATSGGDRMQVVVDGQPADILILEKEPKVYALAHGLVPGAHTVAMFKRTEPFLGVTQFFGFQLEAGAKLLAVPPKSRRIEFIGDSITAGYGNEAANEKEHFNAATENNYLSWDAVAARALDADYLAVAVSGSRLTEKPGEEGMPTFYRRTLLFDKGFGWNFKVLPAPDAVVINLATNDFGKNPPDETMWTEAYRNLLDFVRGNYPQAHIWLATGPMMGPGKHLDDLLKWNAAIVESRHAAGDTRVHGINFAVQNMADGLGADWHPNVKTHQKMADQLVPKIKAELGW